jgi:alpha-beta hydrolase superfamily lysophospholipase
VEQKIKMGKLKVLVVALVICYAVISCGQKEAEYCVMDKTIAKAKDAMKPLGDSNSGHPEPIVRYFNHYNLNLGGERVEHIFGTFESEDISLAGHIYKPARYKATVILMHGYFDHCGQLSHLVGYLLEAGYAVAAFDLPGHGLSAGERGEIDDFCQYSRAMIDFTDTVKKQLDGPYHFIGHSTGAAAILDYLLVNDGTIFDRIVLTAPLVHCAGWEQSKISYNEKIQFVKSVPRIFRKNSSDATFLDFIKNKDPLQARTIPLNWVRALHKWNGKISGLPGCERNIKIIQGTSDETIDWQFNIKFLQEKFKNIEVILIKNANHELFNETAKIRKEVFSQITSYLEN